MSVGPTLLFYALLLVLPVAALAARRVPAATMLKMTMIWLVIFGLGWAVIANLV